MYHSSRAPWRLCLLGICALLLAGGCGGSRQPLPVSGKVVLADGKPATTGNLRFIPDKSKGNDLGVEPIGQIGADGAYQLTTNGQPGVPAGAYKVVVFISKPSNPNDMYSKPLSLINIKYNSPETTDLTKEVKEKPAPDAYDLKLQP